MKLLIQPAQTVQTGWPKKDLGAVYFVQHDPAGAASRRGGLRLGFFN
jgi:hypothetical protein